MSWTPRIDDAGLPHRSMQLLRRERDLFNTMVRILQGRPRADPTGAAGELDRDLVLAGFNSDDRLQRRAACFVAGRSSIDAADAATVDSALRAALARSTSAERVEAAMALALRGAAEAAIPVLRKEAAGGGAASWLAATYIAELGDASGWATIAESLAGDEEHARLMATRQLVAFLPFDGNDVGGQRVDAADRLRASLSDPVAAVRSEAPSLIAEAGLADAAELLRDAANHSPDESVRRAAAALRERLDPPT
jgi:hypothetical protein